MSIPEFDTQGVMLVVMIHGASDQEIAARLMTRPGTCLT
jgi:hypothetical protein